MKLSEKIYYCRKKAGMSQETLAARIGVSRQAVSKWETGEAEPELGKLRLLAEAFGVTADWLLSEAEPQPEPTAEPIPEPPEHSSGIDRLPGVIGKLFRRYGWLAGVYLAFGGGAMALVGYLAFGGGAMALVGYLARTMTRRMFQPIPGMGGTTGDMMQQFSANNPVTFMGNVILVVGILIMLAGILLAIILKKRSREK